jgi:hypothetical protein
MGFLLRFLGSKQVAKKRGEAIPATGLFPICQLQPGFSSRPRRAGSRANAAPRASGAERPAGTRVALPGAFLRMNLRNFLARAPWFAPFRKILKAQKL